ncbi:MAG: biotin synthase BioB [Desulfobacteraceae bacterium]|nr:biotin synthase BioB [Desulfobacteraceae bacterium]
MRDYSRQEIETLRRLPLRELTALALEAKLARRGPVFSFCSIINAKSGRCSEDCRFCVQSAHYRTDSPVYPLKRPDEIVAAAREARDQGAEHFSIVTSGRGLAGAELGPVAAVIEEIAATVEIKVCASLGILGEAAFRRLRAAGLSRYHHNLETSREFFPQVVSTHSFAERVETIAAAKAAGLEVCAGGIIGLGESEDDRISLACTLKECGVDSVPLNFLIPLPGTPLAGASPLAVGEILRAIALFRLILPGVALRLAAGRESMLRDFLAPAFLAGADGMMIGGYLTQRGRPPAEDRRFAELVRELWTS